MYETTSQVYIESNPGPVVTQANNPNNRIELLQSCYAQHGLRILDVGGPGECFFRVVFHQVNLTIT